MVTQLKSLISLYRWRDLVINLVAKEIKVRYMGTLLGFAWSLGNPLSISIVYYLVFTYILPTGQDRFALHLITGIIHWMLLAQVLPQSCDWLISSRNLILKIYFPRLLVPISGMLTVMAFWAIAVIVYWLLFPVLGGVLSVNLIWYPLILLSYMALVFGAGLALSVMQIMHHDVKHLIEVIVPIIFWLTPIVWVSAALPPEVQQWVSYNPLAAYFNALTSILHDGSAPASKDLILCIGLGILGLTCGLWMFRKTDDLVDLL